MSTPPAKPPEILNDIVDVVLRYKPKRTKSSASSSAKKKTKNKPKGSKAKRDMA